VTSKSANHDTGQLLRVLYAHDPEGRTDGQLLDRFLADQDESAFTALIRRHGQMVLGVCRRILANDADSEDAFQATFLVLVRKAASLKSRPILGDWLHGVARRTALKAKAATTHRQAKEQAMARTESTAAEVRNDWLPLLDEELARLPTKYRLPIVLCDLEGKTRREAAEQLGWPEGTVAGRLARARTMLLRGFARRGLVLSGGALAVAPAQNAASASVPTSLLVSTTKAAASFAVGQATATGTIAAKVAALIEGVLQAMFWNKIKNGATVLLLVVLAVVGGGFTFRSLADGQQPNQPQARKEVAVGKEQNKAEPEADKTPQDASKEQWGSTTQGLQMSISVTGKDRVGNPEFQVAFRNVGEQDVALNLGTMLANGKVQLPDNIRLTLTDDNGKVRELHFSDKRHSRVAGRVDDYVVPLRAGSAYTLKLPLSQFWSPNTTEITLELKPGKYQVSAQFEGGGAKHESGRFIMSYWEGKLQSNTLNFE
jgi:RNA polymerase sigma factor (sigma-70 family)